MKIFDVLDVTQMKTPPTHSVWLPDVGGLGYKVPFQFGGRVQKYRKPEEPSYPRETLTEEAALIDALASRSFGVPMREWVFYKTVISDHLGEETRWADPCGAYGFVMYDANSLVPGSYSVEALQHESIIDASVGAWSDAAKPHNIVNGYLVDTRRSWNDRLRYLGSYDITSMPRYVENRSDLIGDLYRDGAFPYREREQPYQEFYLDGAWRSAEREVRRRAALLGMDIKPGDSVLDLGCCIGGFLQYAHLAGASRVVGLDAYADFVKLARRLARASTMNIGAFQFDLTCINTDSVSQIAHHVYWLRKLFPNGIDHLVCLSMGKHLSEDVMWWWIDTLRPRHVYLETNAVKTHQLEAANASTLPYWNAVHERGGRHVGFTNDRNDRAIYRIDRPTT